MWHRGVGGTIFRGRLREVAVYGREDMRKYCEHSDGGRLGGRPGVRVVQGVVVVPCGEKRMLLQ
jgi:hypothetical protein